MTLQEAIDQLVNTGESDPLTIAKKIEQRHDKHWLQKELTALSEDLVAEMARKTLGAHRRSAQIALRPGDQVASGEMRLASVWVPGEGWTKAGELNLAQIAKLVHWYRRLAHASVRRADWFEQVAEMMKGEGVEKLGKLRASLPALPPEELEEAA